MKTNEAPEKIYVHVKNDKVTNIWNSTLIGVRDIEYTRTDAFIDRVCEWIKEHNGDYISIVPDDHLTNNFYDDLRKAMKGE